MTTKVISTIFFIYFLMQFDAIVSIPLAIDDATTIAVSALDVSSPKPTTLEAATTNLANSTSSSENTTDVSSDNDTKLPPLIFPNDTDTFKILAPNNPTTLKIVHLLNDATSIKDKEVVKSTTPLSTIDNNKNETKLEADYYNDEDYTEESEISDIISDSKKIPSNDAAEVLSGNGEGDELNPLNDEVEEIEDNGETPQQELEEQFHHGSLKVTLLQSSDDIDIETKSRIEHGHIALMFAGFILISVTLYLSLIYYRNKLEQRYGMRERLVTEDDYYTNGSQNDLRYFGL